MAIKILRADILTPFEQEQFRKEVEVMGNIQSEYNDNQCGKNRRTNVPFRFIVTLIGACTKRPPYAIVMELMTEGTLSNLLYSMPPLQWIERLAIAEEIAKGIKVLHSCAPPV